MAVGCFSGEEGWLSLSHTITSGRFVATDTERAVRQ